jgi:hypothetical protein
MFYNKIPEQLPTPNIGWEDGAAFVSPAALNLYIGQKCEIGIWGDDFSIFFDNEHSNTYAHFDALGVEAEKVWAPLFKAFRLTRFKPKT